jgi:hypothetical protein
LLSPSLVSGPLLAELSRLCTDFLVAKTSMPSNPGNVIRYVIASRAPFCCSGSVGVLSRAGDSWGNLERSRHSLLRKQTQPSHGAGTSRTSVKDTSNSCPHWWAGARGELEGWPKDVT